MFESAAAAMRLDDQVETALQASPFVVRRNLRFETSEGRVTLRGQVRSYFHKQMAQESLRTVEGLDEIENLIEVAG
jgi:osmotically-inducible protein OsmY